MGRLNSLTYRPGAIQRPAHRLRQPMWTPPGAAPAPPTPPFALHDQFDGPAGLLTAHPIAPQCPAGASWSTIGATFNLDGAGQVTCDATVPHAIATVPAGLADLRAEGDFTSLNGYDEFTFTGFVLRYLDPDNYISVGFEGLNHTCYVLRYANGVPVADPDAYATTELGDIYSNPVHLVATIQGTQLTLVVTDGGGDTQTLPPVTIPPYDPTCGRAGIRLAAASDELNGVVCCYDFKLSSL